ncbi:MAG: hypothetical protein AB2421_07520 [Thermotaleaceae bacterium]
MFYVDSINGRGVEEIRRLLQ